MVWFGANNRCTDIPSGILNGATVTINGSGFGTKSRGLAPLVRDVGAAAVGTLDPQWKDGYTRTNSTAVYNRQNQIGANFNPNSNTSPAGTPHPYITNILAWANAGNDSNTGWRGGPYVDYTIPTLPYAGYACCYFRCDPSWVFSNKNYKFCGMTSTGD